MSSLFGDVGSVVLVPRVPGEDVYVYVFCTRRVAVVVGGVVFGGVLYSLCVVRVLVSVLLCSCSVLSTSLGDHREHRIMLLYCSIA